jgi:hypothetical protein
MEIGEMLSESFEYTKEGLVGKWMKWILLIVCTIIFPLIYGYILKIFRGEKPAPEIDDWVGMFIDGIKMFVIYLVYMIPVIIVMALTAGGAIVGFSSGDFSAVAAGGVFIGVIISVLLALVILLFGIIGIIRFARMDAFGEAFNIGAIMETIGRIGWGSYIINLIILYIVLFIFSFIVGILTAIPIIGWILYLFALPAISIFSARYLTLLYESAGA